MARWPIALWTQMFVVHSTGRCFWTLSSHWVNIASLALTLPLGALHWISTCPVSKSRLNGSDRCVLKASHTNEVCSDWFPAGFVLKNTGLQYCISIIKQAWHWFSTPLQCVHPWIVCTANEKHSLFTHSSRATLAFIWSCVCVHLANRSSTFTFLWDVLSPVWNPFS